MFLNFLSLIKFLINLIISAIIIIIFLITALINSYFWRNLIIIAIEKRDKEMEYKGMINAIEAILESKDKELKKMVDKIYKNI